MLAMPAHMRRHGGVFRKYDCRNRVFEAASGDMEEGFAYFYIAMNGLNHFG